MQKFAQLHPTVGFYRIFPGAVTTPMTTGFPGARLVMPLFRWMTVTPAESAQVRIILLNVTSIPLADSVSTDHVVEGLERGRGLEEGLT